MYITKCHIQQLRDGYTNSKVDRNQFKDVQGRTQRCCCRGTLKIEVLNRAAKAARWGSMRGEMSPLSLGGSGGPPPGKFFKIYVSENAFQAILKPIFAFSITSILSKVRHSDTLFFAIFYYLVILLIVLLYCGTPLAYQITF